MPPVIIIPAYQPSAALVDLINEIVSHGLKVIVVNDGSSQECGATFAQLKSLASVDVLEHATNLGKGQALKTAFNHFLVHYPEAAAGVVTADADGQHLPEDILKVAQSLEQAPASLWLGVREFGADVPLRSRFGNNLTRKVFQWIIGVALKDTQTGLRGIPRKFLKEMLRVHSSGYEFELDMLIQAAQQHIPIQEMSIKTVYLDGNKSSHFNPIVDSLKIYFVFFRYSALSLASAAIDFLLFSLFHYITSSIFWSTAAARILSGTFNFALSRKLVFRASGAVSAQVIKYLLLAVFAMLMSYVLVKSMVSFLGMNVYLSKILADGMIFLTNFAIQRLFIFNSANKQLTL